jgi:TnpA family transposase
LIGERSELIILYTIERTIPICFAISVAPVLTQLNRGEGRHAVARAICYGQRDEIRKRYREGQVDQLRALGLVTYAAVL